MGVVLVLIELTRDEIDVSTVERCAVIASRIQFPSAGGIVGRIALWVIKHSLCVVSAEQCRAYPNSPAVLERSKRSVRRKPRRNSQLRSIHQFGWHHGQQRYRRS